MPILADSLPIFAGIKPAKLRWNGDTLSPARRAMEPGQLLHSALTRVQMHGVQMHGACPSRADARRLKSRHPFAPPAQQLSRSSDNNNTRAAQWADHWWKAAWLDNTTRILTCIPDTGTHPPGMIHPRRAWVRHNHLRTGVGRFGYWLHKWGVASSATCACGAEEQTVDHVIFQRQTRQPSHGLHDLTILDDEIMKWLLNTCP